MSKEYEPLAVYYREPDDEEWELLGVFQDHTDARDVARFFKQRDKNTYDYTTTDKHGKLETPVK